MRGIFSPTTIGISFIFLLNNITVQGLAFFLPTYVSHLFYEKGDRTSLTHLHSLAMQNRSHDLSQNLGHHAAAQNRTTIRCWRFLRYFLPLFILEDG